MEKEQDEIKAMGAGAECYKDLDGTRTRLDSIIEYWAAAGGDIEVSPDGLRNRAELLRAEADRRFQNGESDSETLGIEADKAAADADFLEKHSAEA